MAQDWTPKTCNNQSKAKCTKGSFCTSNFFLQVIGSDPISHGPSCKLEQLPFDHFVIGLHVHHLRCMYSFEHGLDDMTPFHELKGY